MTDRQIRAISRRLLRPYHIPRECPYLSEDQRELSTLDLEGRSAWMAEWLLLAAAAHEVSGRGLRHRSAYGAGGLPPPGVVTSRQFSTK